MKSHQITWICVLGTSTVAGILLAGLALRTPDQPEHRPVDAPDEFVAAPAGLEFELDFPVDVADLEIEEPTTTTAPPEVLPEPEDAVPISPNPETSPGMTPAPEAIVDTVPEEVLRGMIEHELPHATDAEREAWMEEMRGLPADMLAEVLRIRKDLGSLVPRTVVPEIEVEIVDSLPEEVVELPTPTASEPIVRLTEIERRPLENTLVAIGRARRVLLNNVANANSTGYLRRQPLIAELPPARVGDRVVESGSTFGGSSLDATPGPLVATERPLDVAIAGTGFLCFATDEGTVRYRRCASLRIGPNGQLVTVEGHPLEPSIGVPETATVVSIGTDGMVTADVDGSGNTNVGELQIATFPNPEGLVPVGNGYFEEGAASGNPTLGPPGDEGVGPIQSGFLAGANVELERERRELRRLVRQEVVIRELLGEPESSDEPPPLIARPPVENGRQTSAIENDRGPLLVVRPDMLPF